MIKIWMGIPSTGTRSDAQTYILRHLEEKYKDEVKLVYPEVCIHRIFHDFARCEVAKEFLASDCDILWFLDSDIVPPRNVLDLVVYPREDWKVAGVVYPVFMTAHAETGPQIVMTAYERKEGKLAMRDIPNQGISFVDGLATGCMFIKREVLEKLEKPYFEFKYNEERCLIEGEDLGFCRKVNELGYKFYTDFSMVCKHYKTVDLLDVNNYAMGFANAKTLEYDKQIRGQVEALKNKLSAPKQSSNAPKSSLVLPEYYNSGQKFK